MPRNKIEKIKICTGAGCKAWEADQIPVHLGSLRELIEKEGYEVHLVFCINKCGGGACVQMAPGKKLFKLREPQEVCRILEGSLQPAVA